MSEEIKGQETEKVAEETPLNKAVEAGKKVGDQMQVTKGKEKEVAKNIVTKGKITIDKNGEIVREEETSQISE